MLHAETDAGEGVELERLELLIEKRGAETERAECELQPKLIGVDLLRRETKVGHTDAVGVQPRPVEIVTARLISLCIAGVGQKRVHRLVAEDQRSEEHTSELQSLMRISYAVFCLKKKIIASTAHNNVKYSPTMT